MIRVAIVGVGNCASALVQGVSYYQNNYDEGLMKSTIGSYTPKSIEFVLAFDVDERKVGKPLSEAIYSKPNCCYQIVPSVNVQTPVLMAPVLDGVSPHMVEYPDKNHTFLVADQEPDVKTVHEAAELLSDKKIDVLINYLPVGSTKATHFWAEACLISKTAFLNCIPVFIASDPNWAQKFVDQNVPIMGDDMKSQFGASVLSQMIEELAHSRGHQVLHHVQQNSGGNTDFLNMMSKDRIYDKKVSKENVIRNANSQNHFVHAGPSDYVQCFGDTKIAYFSLKMKGFGGAPVNLDMKLEVQDSPNSAGVVIDCIRYLKVALNNNLGGPLYGPCSFTQKSPPLYMNLSKAKQQCDLFAEEKFSEVILNKCKEEN